MVSFEQVYIIQWRVLIIILAVGAWGGIVRFLMKKQEAVTRKDIQAGLIQVVISCFTGFILSIWFIEKGMSFHMIILASGLGGVFGGPLLTLMGQRLSNYLTSSGLLRK